MSIKLQIEFIDHPGGGCGVLVSTEPFEPTEKSAVIGSTWVGVCMAINDYMRANGSPNFDCLKAHRPT